MMRSQIMFIFGIFGVVINFLPDTFFGSVDLAGICANFEGYRISLYCGVIICIPALCDLILDAISSTIPKQSDSKFRLLMICSFVIPNILLLQNWGECKYEIYILHSQMIVLFTASICYCMSLHVFCTCKALVVIAQFLFTIAAVLSSYSFITHGASQFILRIVSFVIFSIVSIFILSFSKPMLLFYFELLFKNNKPISQSEFKSSGCYLSSLLLTVGISILSFIWIFQSNNGDSYVYLSILESSVVLITLLLEGRIVRQSAKEHQVHTTCYSLKINYYTHICIFMIDYS